MSPYLPTHKLQLKLGAYALLLDKRQLLLSGWLVALTLLSVTVSLAFGSSHLLLSEVLATILGQGSELSNTIIFDIRLPRMVASMTAGFALGISGAIVQTVFRNRLASPDVLGINEGATLAIVAYVLYATTASWPFWIAPLGAIIAIIILYQLCAAPPEQGYLFLICGICFTEFLRAIIEFTMSIGALHEIQNIYIWLHGSFVGQGYDTSLPVLVVLTLSFPLQFYIARHLDILALSPQVATSLGFNVAGFKLVAISTAVTLAALGTAIGGPIVFVAMAAPILVSFMANGRMSGLWNAGLVGTLILVVSDSLARTLAAPYEIATGVVTKVLGGIFLFWLLIKDDIG